MNNKTTRKLIGHVAVDSGQLMIGDPCYINADFDNAFDPTEEIENRKPPYKYDYRGACHASLSEEGAGELTNPLGVPLAVCTSTAYGDGMYPVYITFDEDGRPVKMTVYMD